ncbi:MAG: flagellar export protein FliJ [Lachnospiraceae bacterium]
MARFLYKLQNILNIKYKLEEQAKFEFSLANQKLKEEEVKLEHLVNRKIGYEEQAKEILVNTLNIREIDENKSAILKMEECCRIQIVAIETAKKEVEQKRRQLQELMIERKAQEKLKEKAFEEFMQDEMMIQNKEIDELVSYTHGKRQQE